MPDHPLLDNLVPSQIRPEGYPDTYVPAGVNSAAFALDELDGAGLNTVRYAVWWDDIVFGHATVMAAVGNADPNLPNEAGQTVDMWVAKERRTITVPRERNWMRAQGLRGTLDE